MPISDTKLFLISQFLKDKKSPVSENYIAWYIEKLPNRLIKKLSGEDIADLIVIQKGN